VPIQLTFTNIRFFERTYMANQLLTIAMITREALRVLVNNLTFFQGVRKDFDDNFEVKGAKIGTILNIRKPPRYLGRQGAGIQIEDTVETLVPLALNTQFGCDSAFSSVDLTLSIDDFSERILEPQIATVANAIDAAGVQQYQNVFNGTGTPGQVPTTADTYLDAGRQLDEQATPKAKTSPRRCIITPNMQAKLISALKGLLNPQRQVSDQYTEAEMTEALGFDFDMDQNMPTQTFGLLGGTPVVAGANQTGNSIATSGWSNNTAVLNQGDIIQFAGVFAVNPQSRQSTGSLANWVVTANVGSGGGGLATIPIAGPSGNGIVTSGPFQNASASPANNAAITALAASGAVSPQGLAFHKDAFAWGCADLLLPKGVHTAERARSKQLGVSLRYVAAYDINTDRFPGRWDVLGGFTTLYPELATRILS
jgi:hypothetical protein